MEDHEFTDDLWEKRGYAMRYRPTDHDAIDVAMRVAVANLEG